MNKSYLIVIPARGGSKGIPDKNIIEVAGKPLIAYSIELALRVFETGLNGDIVVTTDSARIAKIAREWGGNVPFMRPSEISGDTAKSIEFLLHALEFFENQGRHFDATILLQPTSPLRTVQDILQAVKIYESVGHPSLISAYLEEHVCDFTNYHIKGQVGYPLNPLHNAGTRRQDREKIYVRNAAIYITDVAFMKREKKVFCDTPAIYVMPKSRSVNIDTLEDLELLHFYLNAQRTSDN